MKYLIIYAHPNPKSFNHAIKEIVGENLRKAGNNFETRDLYGIGFSPELSNNDFVAWQRGQALVDINREQDYIRNSDILIFIHPIWWFNMPAILKGYIDRVFSYGFAYNVNENGPYGLLTDKKAILINTTGSAEENYIKYGYKEALRKTIEDGTFGFCGLKIIMHKYFYAVPYVTDQARQKMLEELQGISL
ncbi:MAG: NAD(P)H-dependent oxidoreductase [Candidatus Omnitrophica bacterium]|nr:NAD(P)H-dependent oxidoreductase [Candidatus Omnitrophota bacterium]MBU1922916.1 NAD(P)H-dependent oxidoreductase [Candidatus Omnitrophota bacterium]